MDDKKIIEELFPFKTPLTSKYTKNYIEYLAFEILKFCYPNEYDDFCVCDAPDIQSIDKVMGIEVTEAISSNDAKINNEFAKYRIEQNEENREIRKYNLERGGAILKDSMITYPPKDSAEETRIYMETLEKKMKKVSKYREKGFQKLRLFI